MTTYTYPVEGGSARSGMSAEEVAWERLSHDGHEWELRPEDGGWQLYGSERSVAAYGGSGQMLRLWANSRLLFSAKSDATLAWAELAEQVVFADWPRVPDAMTDEAYHAMQAETE